MFFEVWVEAYRYAGSHSDELLYATQQHLLLVVVPLGIALLIGSIWGWQCAVLSRQRRPLSQTWVILWLNLFNMLRVIPSITLLFLMIPWLGLTFQSAAVALCLLAIPPILLATEVGFRTVPGTLRETGLAMGMTSWQLFCQVDMPVALPIILAGIKTAVLELIASATLAAFIGAGGLGEFITLGFALNQPEILLVGAVPVAGLACLAEGGLAQLQAWLKPSYS